MRDTHRVPQTGQSAFPRNMSLCDCKAASMITSCSMAENTLLDLREEVEIKWN